MGSIAAGNVRSPTDCQSVAGPPHSEGNSPQSSSRTHARPPEISDSSSDLTGILHA
jgi:hypothetical protein